MANYESYFQKLDLDKGILENSFNVAESIYETQPTFKLGYTYYVLQVRQKLEKDDLKKRNIFLITNTFEMETPDHEEELSKIVPKSLSFEKDSKIFTRDFFKLWEMIKEFNFLNGKSVKTACLCENGGFLQCIYYYRNKYHSSKKDSYFYNGQTNKEINDFLKSKFSDVKLRKEVYTPEELFDNSNNLTNLKVIEDIIKKNKLSDIDFITANGISKYENVEFKENNFFKLFVGITLFALKVQSDNGNLIIRFEDCFTIKTLKILSILNDCYKECYIFKPLFSRLYSNEKYLVCKDFKLSSKLKNDLENKLSQLLLKVNEIEDNNRHVSDIISDFEISDKVVNQLSGINSFLINQEHLNINKLIEYYNNKNYFGEQYHYYRNNQIESAKWWFSKYIK